MTSITKIKAEVNNINLPVLGYNNVVYNHYIGSYLNKMHDLGYDLTESEIISLESFIDSGKEKGWLKKIAYFMPVIGSEDAPLTGIVPLIDNVANYQLTTDTISKNFFTISSGKIVAVGKQNTGVVTPVTLPFKTTDIGENSFSVYMNFDYTSDILGGSANNSPIVNAKYNTTRIIALRVNANIPAIEKLVRTTPEGEASTTTFNGTPLANAGNLSFYYANYYKNGSAFYKRFLASGSTIIDDTMTGITSGTALWNGSLNNYIGDTSSAMTLPVKTIGFLYPENLDSADIKDFNRAVTTLISSLGK